MRTINDVLTSKDSTLGHWSMWANSVQFNLSKLILKNKVIPVKHIASEYRTTNGYDWECQHIDSEINIEEIWDSYKELVTGELQPVTSRVVRVCTSCRAWLIPGIEGVWYE